MQVVIARLDVFKYPVGECKRALLKISPSWLKKVFFGFGVFRLFTMHLISTMHGIVNVFSCSLMSLLRKRTSNFFF